MLFFMLQNIRSQEDDKIAFNAGTHMELIKLAYKDFERLVHPKIIKTKKIMTGLHFKK
jgi:prolyl-tRNA editing enzyme YbaK/EbsC (Cys-tRNA(Pro) deacylase)